MLEVQLYVHDDGYVSTLFKYLDENGKPEDCKECSDFLECVCHRECEAIECLLVSSSYWKTHFDWPKLINSVIDQVLARDTDLYKTILRRWCYQCEVTCTVLNREDIGDRYLLDTNEEDEETVYSVVEQKWANEFLQDWIMFSSLPETLPDRTVLVVESFPELIELMKKFNPYWLIEFGYIVNRYTDIARRDPNEKLDYKATEEEIKILYDRLREYRREE